MFIPALAFAVLLVDQVTKIIVRSNFYHGESIPVIKGLFSLTYVRNTGAAWGMLGGQNTFLVILSILMLLLMIVFRKSILTGQRRVTWAFGLLTGGILGNFIDRLALGYVTDFFDFYVSTHHWPVFNIADAAICTGVGLYLLASLRSTSPEPGAAASPEAE